MNFQGELACQTNEVVSGYPLGTSVFKHEIMAGKSLDLSLPECMWEAYFWHLYFGVSLPLEAIFLIFSGLLN